MHIKHQTSLALCLLLTLHVAAQPSPGILINEILFNPVRDGFDYVELYNNGKDSVNLADYFLGNRNATNDPASLKECSKNPAWLSPGAFALLTTNEKWLKQHYKVRDSVLTLQFTLPSFPDSEGTVLLMRKADSVIVDELKYSDKWHFRLIDDVSGVSLERLSYNSPTQNINNWSSASSSSGYGTPGSPNSQRMATITDLTTVAIAPKIFSPDNDGVEDFAFVTITMEHLGYIANSIVYNMAGQRIRYLLKNAVLGLSDTFKWDGYDDRNIRAPEGIYIVVTTLFDLNGNTRRFRNTVIIGNI